jgi:hypothetical protein
MTQKPFHLVDIRKTRKKAIKVPIVVKKMTKMIL